MWLDSRTHKPPTNSFEYYQVVFYHSGIVSVGLCGFMPTEMYTNGEWQDPMHFNMNKMSDGIVLYWRPNPKKAEIKDIKCYDE